MDRQKDGGKKGERRTEGQWEGGNTSVGDPREPCQNKTSARSTGNITGHCGRSDYRVDSSEKASLFLKPRGRGGFFTPARTDK